MTTRWLTLAAALAMAGHRVDALDARVLATDCSSVCESAQPICLAFESEEACQESATDSVTCAGANQCIAVDDTAWGLYFSADPTVLAKAKGGFAYSMKDAEIESAVMLDARAMDALGDDFAVASTTRKVAMRAYGDNSVVGVAVPTKALTAWKGISYLSIRGLDLSGVGTLPTFSQLDTLDLSMTSITSFPLMTTPMLRTLVLDHNTFDTINFQSLPTNLKSLSLGNCSLTKLPTGIEDLEYLENLNLQGNDLSALEEIPYLQALTNLNLSSSSLSDIPVGLYELPVLDEVDLSNNPLGSISKKSIPISATTILLSNTKLKSLPSDLSGKKAWKVIDVSKNKIADKSFTSVSVETGDLNLSDLGLFRMPSLSASWKVTGALELANNAIRTFAIDDIPADITYLGMSNTMLTEMPAELPSLPRIKAIDFSNNALVDIPAGYLPSLTSLTLANCSLTTPPVDLDSMKKTLTVLDLSSNKITSLNLTDFTELTNVRLNDNGLTEIPAGLLSAKGLVELDLRGNQIRGATLTTSEVSRLQKVQTLYFDEDTFSSSCSGDSKAATLQGVYSVCALDDGSTPDASNIEVAPHSAGTNHTPVLLGIGAGALVVILALVAFIVHRRRQPKPDPSQFAFVSSTKGSRMHSSQGIWEDEELLKWRMDVRQIQLVEQIGAGAFGSVWLARYMDSDTVVVKRLHAAKAERQYIQRFIEEIRFMSRFDHPKIVRFIGVAWTMETDVQMVLEHMSNGDLRSYLDLTKDNEHARKWHGQKISIALDMAESLVYLHSLDPKVIHRDLKARNVLLDDRLNAKLADFGLSRHESDNNTMTAAVGTCRWMAPEVLIGRSDYKESVDVYSFGIVMSELDTHDVPFAGYSRSKGGSVTESALLEMITNGELRPGISLHCPTAIEELILACTEHNPEDRPTALDVAFRLRKILGAMAVKARVAASGGSASSGIVNLAVCITGIYICYLSYGIFQEKIFTYRSPEGDKFTATLFMLFVQCVTNSLVAYSATFIWRPERPTMPLKPFAVTASAYLGAMLCSNEALKHVSYPTQALGKSCKMIPVMLMGVLIRRKKYTVRDYICVLFITAGIAVFQIGKASSKHATQENSTYGLLLLFTSLTLDGVSGPKQEEISHTLRPSVHQQMFYTNLWAVIYTGAGALVTGQAWTGFRFCLENPAILNSVFYFSICSALGQNFIYFTIQQFSALTCTTITTTRKFFTILFSVVWYGHQLTTMSWIGVAIVFTGLGWELTSKYQKYQQQQQKNHPHRS
ncbi:hypothetical protein Poli38472_009341 [Pythium oligandrum]|uniref:Protein kinase domain-containing protein n=1 Tax=Pythium oligandrum TaxID=41045 RepID=A0A8K1FLE3_PYTOL|nr:hypothetical protein Poli38472_009341 [Pythium oligandrum]|eukprot:TMW65174.1 hypothetical protein Poli38472_009341 [Pythium oligandrum]